jgi:SAM-dependent methyltransferase/uncharacterized protein YbaR (Trm112 family)
MAETLLPSQFTELQGILCCPHTKSALSLITVSELLRRLPESERHRVPDGSTGALVSEPSLTAYPIVGRIVDFLGQDSLRLSKDGDGRGIGVDAQSDSIRQSVKCWYDEFGWQRNPSGIYNDTAMFSQVTLTAHGFYELSSHLSLLNRLSGGEFVLDAASGPIVHPEKLAHSWFYRYHVCVDISVTALREADVKLAGRGFCCMADICQLPFRDGVFDGVVSAYTVQHVAESRQSKAVAELYRVLKPGAHLCVISGIRRARAHRGLLRAVRGIKKALRLLQADAPLRSGQLLERTGSQVPPHDLYYRDQDLAWWRKLARGLTNSYSVEGVRLFNREEFEFLFGDSMRAAKAVRALEALFPRIAARMCAYILVDLSKTKVPLGRVGPLDLEI